MVSLRRNVNNYLLANKLFSSFRILDKKSGLSNDNYILESKSEKYIIRLNKTKPNNSSNPLDNEYNLLKFLEAKKINFVPRTLFYDKTNNVHILRYIEGKLIRFRNLSRGQMKQVLEKLHQINILDTEYRDYCHKNNIPALKSKSEIEGLKKRIKNRVTDCESLFGKDPSLVWVRERLENDFKNYKTKRSISYLNHGDPADNLIVQGKNISIIDWEYVKSTYGPGIVHIIAHGRLDKEREKYLLKTYAEISSLDYDELVLKTYKEKMAYYLLKYVKLLCHEVNKDFSQDEKNKHLEHLKYLYTKTGSRGYWKTSRYIV